MRLRTSKSEHEFRRGRKVNGDPGADEWGSEYTRDASHMAQLMPRGSKCQVWARELELELGLELDCIANYIQCGVGSTKWQISPSSRAPCSPPWPLLRPRIKDDKVGMYHHFCLVVGAWVRKVREVRGQGKGRYNWVWVCGVCAVRNEKRADRQVRARMALLPWTVLDSRRQSPEQGQITAGGSTRACHHGPAPCHLR